jgi:Lon protease-like protein
VEVPVPAQTIPLFPLNVVLFPGMIIPLRIFEPRYRLMIQRCIDEAQPFGIAMIKDGDEVGGPAVPHDVGTLAEISEAKRMPDGQLMIQAVGLRRFRIRRMVEGEPYAQAEVDILDEAETPIDPTLFSAALKGIHAYVDSLATLTRMSIELPDAELSAIDWSFLIAAALQISNDDKQAVLEQDDVEERLKQLVAFLESENQEVVAFLAKSRANGDVFFKGFKMSVN